MPARFKFDSPIRTANTYTDTINAIINGGTTVANLQGKIKAGKKLNAFGAFSYVAKPEMVSVTVSP